MTPRTPLPTWLDRSAFPFDPTLVTLASGEQLSVTRVGRGPTVVFSHGTPTWSYEWRHHLLNLRADFDCVAPDHLGFGLSPRPVDGDYRPEAHAARFRALLDALGVDRYHLVVHDFGGPFALDAALEQPERVASLVCFNTFAWDYGDTPVGRRRAWAAGTGLFRWLYRHLNFSFLLSRSAWGDRGTDTKATWAPYRRLFESKDDRERVLWALAKAMRASAPFCASLWDRRERLAKTPIHLVWGLADSAFGPDTLERLRGAWPHASCTALEGAGHWPHEEQPDRCVEEVRRFVVAHSR